VTVQGVNDSTIEPDAIYSIAVSVASADTNYNHASVPSIAAVNAALPLAVPLNVASTLFLLLTAQVIGVHRRRAILRRRCQSGEGAPVWLRPHC
jgi:hypothetical protein